MFFAMDPTNPYYERIRVFFEYTSCICNDVGFLLNVEDIEIYNKLNLLRNVYIAET